MFVELKPIRYKSTLDTLPSEWSYYGFIAEEVAEVDPRLAVWGTNFLDQYDEDGQPIMGEQDVPVGVMYERIPVIMLVAFKKKFSEMQSRIDALENKINQLQEATQ